jgi:methyl-accepting chemotaxis protein
VKQIRKLADRRAMSKPLVGAGFALAVAFALALLGLDLIAGAGASFAQASGFLAVAFGLVFLAFVIVVASQRAGAVEVAERLQALAVKTAGFARAAKAQRDLDANLNGLRGALEARGAARIVGDKLYFGDYLVNGETGIVDDVKRRYGGVATVFIGDTRCATNVTNAAGTRAVGTRLAAGPPHDKLFGECATFHGQAQILGRNYITIYEPILIDDRAIGAIFVGVPFEAATADVAGSGVADMQSSLAIVDVAVEEKAAVDHEAMAARYQGADQARRVAARVAAASAAQRLVVGHLTEALSRLADNDLTHRIEAEFPSEYRALKVNFDRAAETLAATVGAVVSQGRAIFDVTAQISHNADDLSQRAEQQAASLEQSAAALNEIAATSKRSAEGASHARSVVAAADSDAAHSAVVVDEAIAAMREIEGSAGKIGQIVALIDEIAFQTNLLALNAGVEAARAGEAGRGFAVVASEVRALALRSAGAAKDIRGLITASAAEVGRGVALVTRTGEALKRIVEQVGQLYAIVGDIAAGSKEQASGLGEVSAAINQMDQITQANAAIAQRSNETARTLEGEAERLNALVQQFRIAEGSTAARAA